MENVCLPSEGLAPYNNSADKNARSSMDLLMTETMREAAEEASIADGVVTSSGDFNVAPPKTKPKNQGLRRGKWTPEEEAYANRLIEDFKSGLLPLADGTTLRTFLSKLLNCDPMRISKKYVGNNCIGKQVYRRRQEDIDTLSAELLERHGMELAELEREFHNRLNQGGRSRNATKAAREGRRNTSSHEAKSAYAFPSTHFAAINGSSDQSLTATSPMLPWISPDLVNPSTNSEFSPPYVRSGQTAMEGVPCSGGGSPAQSWSQQWKLKPSPSQPSRSCVDSMQGLGPGRGLSEYDLLNYPHAFTLTSSLDILGTLAEIKLPSASSLENLQKYSMDTARSTSLNDWYASQGAQKSAGDIPVQFGAIGATDCSDYGALQSSGGAAGGVYFHRGSGVTPTSANPASDVCGATGSKIPTAVWRGVNGEILHADSFLGASSRGAGRGGGAGDRSGSMSDSDEFGIRHSLSRELLDVVAAATNYEERNGCNDATAGVIGDESICEQGNIKSEKGPSGLRRSARDNSSAEMFMKLAQLGDLPEPDPKGLMSSVYQPRRISVPSSFSACISAGKSDEATVVPASATMAWPGFSDQDSELHVVSSASQDSVRTEREHSAHSSVLKDERKRKIAQLDVDANGDADIPAELLKVHRPSFL